MSQPKTVGERADEPRTTLVARQNELATVRETLARRERLVSKLSISRWFGISGSIAFCVLLVHLLLYLFRTPDPPIPFRPALYATVVILLLFALPAFAADALDQDLVTANHLLTASPAERGLSWLTQLEGQGTLPAEVTVTDSLLTPVRELQRGSVEYYFTRAALLWEMHEREAAFGALHDAVAAAPQGNPAAVYARMLQFLAREDAATLPDTAAVLLPRIRDRTLLTTLALDCAKAGKDTLAKKASEAIGSSTSGAAEIVPALHAFYEANRRELTTPLASAAVAKVSNAGDLATLVSVALEHADRTLAITVIEQGIGRLGPSVADAAIEDPALLYPKDELPGDPEISLAVLLGILNQKEGLTAGAKPAYEHGAASELERVLASGGFAFPARLRSLFYIERFWRQQGDETRLRLLRPVYERVQDTTVARLRGRRQPDSHAATDNPSSDTAAFEKATATADRELATARAALRRLNIRLSLRIARLVGIVLALVLILLGCLRWARRRIADRTVPHPATGWRFIEACGWVLVLSVIGVWLGLPLVLLTRQTLRGLPVSAATGT